MSDDRRLKTEPGAEGDRPLLLREIEFAWRPGRVWFLLLAFLLVASVLVSFSSGHFLKRGWDGYSYLATIRSLGEIEEDPGRYANPAYVIVGAFYRQLDTDPLNLLAVLAVINALVFLWAAYLFFSLHFRRETVFYILFAMLFFWGRLRWSGAYSFVDTYDYFYPQGIAYSFLLLSFYFLYRSSNGERRFLALMVFQALLIITHIATSLYYWLIALLYLFAVRKRLGRRFTTRFVAAAAGSYALALSWPYYDYAANVLNFFDVLQTHLRSGDTAWLMVALPLLPAAVLAFDGRKALRYALPATLVVLPLLGPHTGLLVNIFGFGVVGIVGLLLLVKEGRLLFPLWWGVGAILFTIGFVDPTRIIMASSFALHAGAGVALSRFVSKPRKLYLWLFIVLGIVTCDLYFIGVWKAPAEMTWVVAALAILSVIVLVTGRARALMPAILILLAAAPMAIKWNEIRLHPTIEPKYYIAEHVRKWEKLLVVEPSRRGMNKVICGTLDRRAVFVERDPEDDLSIHARRHGTPYVLFYRFEPSGVGAEYDILGRDEDSVLIRLRL